MKLKSIKNYFPQIFKEKEKILIFLIIFSGALLKLYTIKTEPLWLDEKYSLLFASNFSFKELTIFFNQDVHPGGYYFLLKFLAIFSKNIYFLRFFSSLIFQILATVILGKHFLKKKNFLATFFVSIFLSFHPLMVRQAWQLRMYSLLTFLASLSSIYFDRYNKEKSKKNILILFALSVLGIYIDYSYLLLSFIIFSFIAYENKNLKQFLLYNFSFFFEFLLISSYQEASYFDDLSWIPTSSWGNLADFYLEIMGLYYLPTISFILLLLGFIIFFKKLKHKKELLFIFSPFLISSLYSILSKQLSNMPIIGHFLPGNSFLIARAHIAYLVFFLITITQILNKKYFKILIIIVFFLWIPTNLNNLKPIYSLEKIIKIEFIKNEKRNNSLFFPESLFVEIIDQYPKENLLSELQKNREFNKKLYQSNNEKIEKTIKNNYVFIDQQSINKLDNKQTLNNIMNKCKPEKQQHNILIFNCLNQTLQSL